MAVVTAKGSRIMTGLTATPPTLADAGEGGGRVHYWCETVEVGSSDSATSTYLMAYLPSNARICGHSTIYWDDLASTGSPTLDVGLYNITGSAITDDPDALNDGLDCASAAGSARIIKDISNYGKRVWEFVSGQTSDPKCDLALKVALVDAAVNTGGTVTVEIFYTTD